MASERGCPRVKPPIVETLRFEHELPCIETFLNHFSNGGRLHIDSALRLLQQTSALLREEPNVLTLCDPITVVGDIHGQYFDLVNMLRMTGLPPKSQFLFLGDYVDRGYFSSEVTFTIYALKVLFPSRVWLLRGNHECRHLTTYFNFKAECLNKYDLEVYDAFQSSFDTLPLAAILNDRFLCVHGGLSPEIRVIDDIMLIDRFREPPTSGPMCDLLWSDPMEEEEEELCPNALFLFNELRGCSYVFSFHATQHFLTENNLLGIIRAHEAQDEGYRFFRKMPGSGFPSVICIFSAPNYCDSYDNKAAFLQVSDGELLQVKQFHSSVHPYYLPNFMNAFDWSLPFVVERIHECCDVLWGDEEEEVPVSKILTRGRVILKKVRAVMRFLWLLRVVQNR
jgi:serine/threonine-protein phosphatase 2B catalytic subunit